MTSMSLKFNMTYLRVLYNTKIKDNRKRHVVYDFARFRNDLDHDKARSLHYSDTYYSLGIPFAENLNGDEYPSTDNT